MSDIKRSKVSLDEYGRYHGECIGYYSNNQLAYLKYWANGIKHGLQEGYRPDGILSYRGYRNMGRMAGYWYWYRQKYYYLHII